MNIKEFFEMQKKYEAKYLEQKPISNEMKTCDDDADCPEVGGVALTCDAEGICAPAED